MALHRVRAPAVPVPLDFEMIRRELDIPEGFSPVELQDAAAAARTPLLAGGRIDATALELVAIDPPGSRDLDQAMAISTTATGWRVHYAIADLSAWIEPFGALDQAAKTRTQTFYSPDLHRPLHPPVLNHEAASLLPDGDRPAILWTIDVDADGSTAGIDVQRALVRNRAQLTYGEVQATFDAGDPVPAVRHLPQVGEALLANARERNAIDLGLPDQEVVPDGNGHWTIRLRADLPVEVWNAQVSLLTGRAAATLMLDAGIGILRTLPPPDESRFPALRIAARGLGIDWRADEHPGDVLARLDPSRPRHAAFADLSAELLRGAGYTVVNGTTPASPDPDGVHHGGVGAPYAHVTAPLRRLVDRFASEIAVAVAAGRPVPEWVDSVLDELPDLMRDGDRRAKALDRAIIDATEAFVLADRVGEVFTAAVIETGDKWGTVVIDQPAVRARCDTPDLPLGEEIEVRCTVADIVERKVRFEQVG